MVYNFPPRNILLFQPFNFFGSFLFHFFPPPSNPPLYLPFPFILPLLFSYPPPSSYPLLPSLSPLTFPSLPLPSPLPLSLQCSRTWAQRTETLRMSSNGCYRTTLEHSRRSSVGTKCSAGKSSPANYGNTTSSRSDLLYQSFCSLQESVCIYMYVQCMVE